MRSLEVSLSFFQTDPAVGLKWRQERLRSRGVWSQAPGALKWMLCSPCAWRLSRRQGSSLTCEVYHYPGIALDVVGAVWDGSAVVRAAVPAA